MDNKPCPRCQKNEAGNSKVVDFFYNKRLVMVFDDRSLCKECVKQEWIDTFEKHCADIIRVTKNGAVKVDWQAHKTFPRKEAILRALSSLRVLSQIPERNYLIITTQHILNPVVIGSTRIALYFTDKRDATNFAKEVWGNIDYNEWLVVKKI